MAVSALTAGCILRPWSWRPSFGIPLRLRFFLIDLLLHCSIAFVTAGATDIIRDRQRTEVLHPASPEQQVSFTGTVLSPPTPTRSGCSFVVRTDSLSTAGRSEDASRDILVYGRTHHRADAIPGQKISAIGILGRFPSPRNPGEHDYGAVLSLNGVSAVVHLLAVARKDGPANVSVASLVGRTQQTVYRWIDTLHPGERGGFLKGVLLGYRADLPDDLRHAFQETGTVHILAVSGSNVALIALVVLACSGFLRAGRSIRAIMTGLGIVAYMLVTGAGPSIVRATVMGAAVVAMMVVRRKGDVYQSLGLAACVLLIADPRNLFDVGFQLSFASVLGIVAGYPITQRWISMLPEEFRESRVLRVVLQLCGVTLMAQIATLPIVLSVFGRVSLVSVAVNLLVVPMSGLVLLLGVAELISYPVAPWVAGVYAEGNGLVMDMLLGSVRLAARAPYAAIDLPLRDPEVVVIITVLVIVFFAHGMVVVRRWAIVVILLAANVLVVRSIADADGRGVDWIALDVGQGDAHLLRTPGGLSIMVDTGPSVQVMERTILPLLNRLGVRRIDAVIISHPHTDHTGGLPVLLNRLPVSTLIVSDSVDVSRLIRSEPHPDGPAVLRVSAGERVPLAENIRMYVLHPHRVDPDRGWNDNSVVFQLRYGTTSAMFMGDAESAAETEVASRWRSFISVDVLKAGHHGSSTSSTPGFVDSVGATDAVITAGWRNRFGHPSPVRLEMFRSRAVRLHQTGRDGAVWLRSDGRRWSTVDWR